MPKLINQFEQNMNSFLLKEKEDVEGVNLIQNPNDEMETMSLVEEVATFQNEDNFEGNSEFSELRKILNQVKNQTMSKYYFH